MQKCDHQVRSNNLISDITSIRLKKMYIFAF